MTFLERTTDARRFRHWEGDIEADYIYTSGIAGERFFVALRDEGRLLAARCEKCDLAYLPPRSFCERCFSELTTFVDVPPVGRVESLTTTRVDRSGEYLATPEPWAFVTFRGIHGGLIHRLLMEPERARVGIAVRPRMKAQGERVGAITDIEGFEPARSPK